MTVASKRKMENEEPPLFAYLDTLKPVSKPIPKKPQLFPGPAFDSKFDLIRLSKLQYAVFSLMSDGQWRTHSQIKQDIQQGSENGISAMLRNLRHKSRGGHTVEKRRVGDPHTGVWKYRLIVNAKTKVELS